MVAGLLHCMVLTAKHQTFNNLDISKTMGDIHGSKSCMYQLHSCSHHIASQNILNMLRNVYSVCLVSQSDAAVTAARDGATMW